MTVSKKKMATQAIKSTTINPKTHTLVELEDYSKQAYLGYAMSVVKGRAIPDIEDGLKPVQRRILFSMHRLGLSHNNSPKKSARVVGDCLGQFHPHGDSATYEAMVRMSQSFSLRYPLVHGEGNFGSRDGDNAAAYRYTEAKLTPIAETLLKELSWDTVDFQPNYDGKEQEPCTLPSRLPMLLLNGASGIGVGMATEFLSHQLNEVVEGAKLLLQKPKTTLDELMVVIPGPDFPTGGQIISTPQEIKQVYTEARGSLRIRAKWEIVMDPNNKDWKLIFTEIPQNTNTEKVLLEIDELLNPKQKEKNGKKLPLTSDQSLIKKTFSELIDNYQDHSDQEHPIRLAITPKNRKVNAEHLAIALCKHTTLESNIPANFVAVNSAGCPVKGTILFWLNEWCDYRIKTVLRRCVDEKKHIDHRIHILSGRISILDRIHEVITMLTTSDDPKNDLMQKYGLDLIQAEDVLDMRLRQLARLEKTKLVDEKTKLEPESARLGALIANNNALRKLIIKELDADAKTFGDMRRTTLQAELSATTLTIQQDILVDKTLNDPIAVAFSERGWMGWKSLKTPNDLVSHDDFKLLSGDTVKSIQIATRSDFALFLDVKGRGYSLALSDLPSKNDSAPPTSWFEPPNRIDHMLLSSVNTPIVLSGSSGYGFIINSNDWINRMKAGKALLTIKEGEIPLQPILIPVEKKLPCVAVSQTGRITAFHLDAVKTLTKGRGNILMKLKEPDTLSDIQIVNEDGSLLMQNDLLEEHLYTKEDIAKVLGSKNATRNGKILVKGQVWNHVKTL